MNKSNRSVGGGIASKSRVGQSLPHVSLWSKVMKGGTILVFSKGFAQACSIARNIIVARLIGVQNFGIAATFSIMVSVLDMIANLSVDKMMIQAKDGNDESFQSTAHMMQALRGTLAALIVLSFAPLVARLFSIPEATWAFRYLALIPFLRGLVHLDQQRTQREMSYNAAAWLEIIQQLIPTLAAWPIAHLLRDYSAMLWLLVLQSAVTVLGSFLLARRSYRWRWNSELIRRFYSFGWPLILNGVLLFGIFQGDRFLIGSAKELFGSTKYSLKDLGVYSVAMSLTFTPTIALSNISISLLLPLFSGMHSNIPQFHRKYKICAEMFGFISGPFALFFILAGGPFVALFYGHAYYGAGALAGWMAAMQALRISRLTPTTAAMALGDTKNALTANVVRVVSMVATIYIVLRGSPLIWFAIVGFAGELLALAVSIWRLAVDHQIPVALAARPAIVVICCMGVAGIATLGLQSCSTALELSISLAIIIVFFPIMCWFFPTIPSLARRHGRDLRRWFVAPSEVSARA
jgi:O-antigen/teichoic acid export membrane protein